MRSNEIGTSKNNEGNEALGERISPPLDLEPKESIEADLKTLPYSQEDWESPKQIEVPKNMEPDLRFLMQTRQSDRAKPAKNYNPFGDNFVVERIDLKKILKDMVGLEEITVSQEVDIVDDQDKDGIDVRSKLKAEFDDEQQQSYE